MKKIEISIVCIALLAIAFVFGCKKKPVVAKDLHHEQEVEIVDYNGIDITELEQEQPMLITFADKDLDRQEWVSFELSKDYEIVCDSTREKWLNVIYQCLSGKEPNEPVVLRFKEPNDMVFTITLPEDISPSSYPAIWADTYTKPPEVIHYSDGTGKIFEYIPKPFEPNETWTITKEESELVQIKEPEPNDPELSAATFTAIPQGWELIEPNEPEYIDTICGTCGESIKPYKIGDPNAVLHYHEPKEPDPKQDFHCSCGESMSVIEITCLCGKIYKTAKIIMKTIPTWPDYIELDKDLIFDFPEQEDYPIIQIPPLLIQKGTKIYFKDD